MWLLLGLLGLGGGYLYYKSQHEGFGGTRTPPPSNPLLPGGLPVALDPNLPDFNRAEVTNAIYYQNDPSVLLQMADAYQKNGFPMAAAVLSAKAHGVPVGTAHA